MSGRILTLLFLGACLGAAASAATACKVGAHATDREAQGRLSQCHGHLKATQELLQLDEAVLDVCQEAMTACVRALPEAGVPSLPVSLPRSQVEGTEL